MRWILLCLVLMSGCVQIDSEQGNSDTSVPEDQFASADAALVAKIIEQPELQDAARLRRYAAFYSAVSLVLTEDKELSLPKVLAGVEKSTGMFLVPRSVAMQTIVSGVMPTSTGAETDRAEIQKRFASLSLACHAAAHKIDSQKSK